MNRHRNSGGGDGRSIHEVYVSGIPADVNEADIKELFSQAGTVLKIKRFPSKLPEYPNSTYGFIGYDNVESARRAIQLLNGTQVQPGYPLKVKMSDSRKQDGYTTENEYGDHGASYRGFRQMPRNGSAYAPRGAPQQPRNSFNSSQAAASPTVVQDLKVTQDSMKCAVCCKLSELQCSACKSVKYCSAACQHKHWTAHKDLCVKLRSVAEQVSVQSRSMTQPQQTSSAYGKASPMTQPQQTSSAYAKASPMTQPQQTSSAYGKASPMTQPQQTSSAYGKASPMQDSRLVEAPRRVSDVQRETLNVNEDVKVLLNLDAFQSPENFYVLKNSMKKNLDELWETIKNLYANSSALVGFRPSSDDLCVAPYSPHHYHRAYVQEVVSETDVRVFFVDIGVSKGVKVDALRRINPELLRLPMQAIPVKLNGIQNSKWTTETLAQIKSLLGQCLIYHAKALTFNPINKTYSIQLVSTAGTKVAETLIEKGLARGEGKPAHPVLQQRNQKQGPRQNQPRCPNQNGQGGKPHNQGKKTSSTDEDKTKNGKTKKHGSPKKSASTPAPKPDSTPAPKPDSAPAPKPSSDVKPTVKTVAENLSKGQTINFTLANLVSPSQFWIHLRDENLASGLSELQQQLQVHCRINRGQKNPPGFADADPLVAAIFPADESWYRAQVLSKSPHGYHVRYIDYGNEDDTNDVLPLPKRYYSHPVYAIECGIEGISCKEEKQWPDEATKDMVSYMNGGESPMSAIVQLVSRNMVLLDVKSPLNGDSLSMLMVNSGHAIYNKTAPNNKPHGAMNGTTPAQPTNKVQAPSNNQQKTASKKGQTPVNATNKSTAPKVTMAEALVINLPDMGTPVDVVVMDASSVDRITVVKELMALQELQNLLATLQEKHNGSYLPKAVGELIVGKFIDGAWYRATVLALHPDKADVEFVDYGNRETLACDMMATAPEPVTQLPVYGMTCRLHGIAGLAPGASWNASYIEAYTKHCITVTGEEGNVLTVKLVDDKGIDIGQKLVQTGVVLPTVSMVSSLPQADVRIPSERQKCLLLVAASVNDILIQIDIVSVATVTDILTAGEHRAGYKPRCVGELVIGKFTEDEQWYRAEVISISGDNCTLKYIDYGNTEHCTAERIATISNDLKSIPALGLKCCLAGVPDSAELPAASLVLGEVYEVRFISQVNDTYQIELFLKDSMINEMLKKKTVTTPPEAGTSKKAEPERVQSPTSPAQTGASAPSPTSPILTGSVSSGLSNLPPLEPLSVGVPILACIVHMNSPTDFYVFLFSNQDKVVELNNVTSNIGDSPTCPARVGDVVSVMVEGEFYRMDVLSINAGSVNLKSVDYGFSHTAKPSEIKSLHPQFKNLPRMTHRCSVAGIGSASGSDVWTEEELKKTTDVVQGKVDITVKEVVGDVNHVDVVATVGDEERVNVGEFLVKIGAAVKISHGAAPALEAIPAEPPVSSTTDGPFTSLPALNLPSHFTGGVMVVNSPNSLYIQPESADVSLLAAVKAYCESVDHDKSFRPEVGEFCCVYHNDQCWYRARVLEKSKQGCRVHFVDFGDEGFICFNRMRRMTAELARAPPLAAHCKLHDVVPVKGSSWSEKEVEEINKTFLNQTLQVKVASRDDDMYGVILSNSSMTDMADDLIKRGIAARPQNNNSQPLDEVAMLKAQVLELQKQLAAVKNQQK